MLKVMGIIQTMNESDALEQLTYHRCAATVPFAARYRLIDFVMSSMVNSGMTNVAVLLQQKYRSLMDHLGAGKEWDLDRKRSGLFLLPPTETSQEQVCGDLYSLYKHRDYLFRSDEDYVLITSGNAVCNVDFRPMFHEHVYSGADVTVLYKDADASTSGSRTIVMNSKGRVSAVYGHSLRLKSDSVSMDMYLMKKELLMDLMETALAHGQCLSISDMLMKHIDSLQVRGCRYQGYLGVIDSLENYYMHSMNMLNPIVWKDLFLQTGLIYTKIKDEPPASYKANANVSNSLIANGCIIEGTVENSILFRGVHIHKGAHVRNSIIMQAGQVFDSAVIDHAVLDKDVVIHAGRTLGGHPLAPYVAGKRKVI
jgi:glucose-1-phosphate adenylyltransferase